MERPHLLAIPFPAQGHINPMLQLCKKLASSGIFVTLLIPVKQETFITTLEEFANLRFVFLPDAMLQESFTVETDTLQYVTVLEANLRAAIPQMIENINRDQTVPLLTCIFTDVTITGLRDIACEFGVCKASLSTFSASWDSIQNGLQLLQDNGLLPLKGTDRIIDFIPGLPPISAKDFPLMLQQNNPRDPGFKIRMRRIATVKSEDWVFLNTFQELESSQLQQLAIDRPHFLPVGPLLPSFAFDDSVPDESDHRCGFWREDLSCLEWLDEQPNDSVVYVSFGSLATVSADQLSEIHTGLKESGQRFLWVLRPDMVKSFQLPEDSSDGKFVSWAPQLKVLKHPSVALFFTHCGWNSVLEAVVTGIPVLGWPFVYEQRLNCALAVEHWKIGLRLPQTATSSDDPHPDGRRTWQNLQRERLEAQRCSQKRSVSCFTSQLGSLRRGSKTESKISELKTSSLSPK